MEDLHRLIGRMTLNGPASREAIERVETALGRSLPSDYREFLLQHNGGEGLIGDEGYGAFFPVEELPSVQEGYSELDHLAGWLIFGSTMGGEAWLFDEDGGVLQAPFIGDREDAVPQGSFIEFLRRQGAGLFLASLADEAVLTIRDGDGSGLLVLVASHSLGSIQARLDLLGLRADVLVPGDVWLEPEGHLYERAQDAVAGLCEQMANSWKGWSEPKCLRADGLTLTCDHDGQGHVGVDVELRMSSWQCAGRLSLEAGQLADVARRARAFAAVADKPE